MTKLTHHLNTTLSNHVILLFVTIFQVPPTHLVNDLSLTVAVMRKRETGHEPLVELKKGEIK
jgi:hypothetical protein